MDYQQQIQEVVSAYEARNQFYWTVAPIVSKIYYTNGQSALKEFSQDVRDALGTDDVNFKTLETYAWTYGRTGYLDIPKDLSLNAIQKIASIKDDDKREKFVDLVNEQGLSSSDIIYKLKYK